MKRPGELEASVMRVMWDAGGPLTARQVADLLVDRGLAYTTVLTVMARLEKKGVLQRSTETRAHRYSPVASREDHVAVLMRQALGEAPDRTAALQHFARTASPEEAAALREALGG